MTVLFAFLAWAPAALIGLTLVPPQLHVAASAVGAEVVLAAGLTAVVLGAPVVMAVSLARLRGPRAVRVRSAGQAYGA